MLINIFGGLIFSLYLCVGALLFGGKYKAGWSILGPVVSVTIVQSYGEIFYPTTFLYGIFAVYL